MSLFSSIKTKLKSKPIRRLGLAVLAKLGISFLLLALAKPAFAHHPFGGGTPSNFIQGFLSGLGHPVIGIDHLTFVIAIGLMALLVRKSGFLLPVAFTLAASLGAIIHLQSFDLPFVEPAIAFSVLAVGVLLAWQRKLGLALLILLSAIAGVFHGFAYGEAIFGAEMTPIGAYLLGFTSIQLAISAIAFKLGRSTLVRLNNTDPNSTPDLTSSQEVIYRSLPLRFAGFLVTGVGIAFLSSALIG